MPRTFKQLLYVHYWWLATLLFAIGSAVILGLRIGPARDNILALGGGLAGAFYFLQKQHLEELALFERLFADFNRRYGLLADRLEVLLSSRAPLLAADVALLENYFNLCAEEYFYFTSGIIDSRVWCAWCRGMQHYLHDSRIAEFWRREQASDCHYGLTLGAIEAGARVKSPPKENALGSDRGELTEKRAA